MKRTDQYAAMTKDEAQRSRWSFYEAVNIGPLNTVEGKSQDFAHVPNHYAGEKP
jgi:hypothetical protein